MARKPRRDRSEVSCVIKYLVFGFNVAFWVLGGLLAAAGIWAWSEKDTFNNISNLTKVTVDPALFLIIIGIVVFIIGFFGCVGALRENTVLLLIYCVCISVIFGGQLVIGILVFAYKDWFCLLIGVIFFFEIGCAAFLFIRREWVRDQVKNTLKEMIVLYREDQDLQNLIDWVQQDWLKCCGVEGYDDWNNNMYFNCSPTSASTERCGVPFSCCKFTGKEAIKNRQCGYGVRGPTPPVAPSVSVYTEGCLKVGEKWFNDNLIPVAGVVVAIALIQILGICFAQNLRSDIQAQKSKWSV